MTVVSNGVRPQIAHGASQGQGDLTYAQNGNLILVVLVSGYKLNEK